MTDYQLRPDRDLTVLIPARAGSKRIIGKNTKLLGGKPLLQWSIEAAKAANVAKVIVSTDDIEVAGGTAVAYGCALHERKPEHATDSSPDIEWVLDVLPMVETPYVAICRPTSPFRTAGTIRRAYAALVGSGAHTLRAVRPVKEHPGKMWMVQRGQFMVPLLPFWTRTGEHAKDSPWHSSPTQSLPKVYVQTASLEMFHRWVPEVSESITFGNVLPFLTDETESFDINTPEDWEEAERLAERFTAPASSSRSRQRCQSGIRHSR